MEFRTKEITRKDGTKKYIPQVKGRHLYKDDIFFYFIPILGQIYYLCEKYCFMDCSILEHTSIKAAEEYFEFIIKNEKDSENKKINHINIIQYNYETKN